MNVSSVTAKFGEWLHRAFSFGLVLVLAASLTLAKAVTIALDFGEEDRPREALIAGEPANLALQPPEPTLIDEENFIPWPTNLPEPAAGPEADNPLASAEAGGRQLPSAPSNFTEGEILALQQLAARREELDRREEMLDVRAELNGQAEARIDKQIDKLAELKTQLEELMKGLDENEERKLAQLVKIYETMKPKAAAEIFNRLELSILIHVVERMKEAKSAAVLGKMDPAIAKQVTTELARKKERPTLDGAAAEGEA